MKRMAIIGSRSFDDLDLMRQILDRKFLNGSFVIVSGGARGADSLAIQYAKERKLFYVVYPADWDKYGKSAGFIRNKTIIDSVSEVVCFWDGKSKGSKHSMDYAKQCNKPIEVVRF